METGEIDNSVEIEAMNLSREEILADYLLSQESRQLSIAGRKEVLTGKAKFGIFGDGKELAQIAYAKQFKNGDWRSGYYRDQTFILASGMTSLDEFFAQLYGHTDIKYNPSNGGRNFNNHYGSRSLTNDGEWKPLTAQKNTASDVSPTAGQMPRLVGLALASKLYRQNKDLHQFTDFSINGNEVAFGMIGDASTSEGHFFETLNAAGVLQIPYAIAVWDDGYGISVPKAMQTTKGSISELLAGFQKEPGTNGIQIFKAKGWDYMELVTTFRKGIEICRNEHTPVLFHIEELTQPLGHSTSGSHERYKSKERLDWEAEHDCLLQFRKWIIEQQIASEEELDQLENEAFEKVKAALRRAKKAYLTPIQKEKEELLNIIRHKTCSCTTGNYYKVDQYAEELEQLTNPIRKDVNSIARRLIHNVCNACPKKDNLQEDLNNWINQNFINNFERYSDRLHCESKHAALNVKMVPAKISEKAKIVTGRDVLNANFDYILANDPRVVIFGEDSGKIGGVNQCLEGLQDKYGPLRVFDTGIRESTITGKGIGLALRGLRPIAEIQYFDYLLYTLQTLSDDLATLHWRTAGGQVAPVIIRTRGHRLEGVWHSGSPLSMVINSIRGIYVGVPRNMTQAAGMYNTLLQSHDPALIIEPLNGYRLKETLPENVGKYTVPLGIPEVIQEGKDITVVTYGSCIRIAKEAMIQLSEIGIEVELIDVQTLLPFDLTNKILDSVKKTKKIIFFDEDVPGGATAYMMQNVIEKQGAYKYLEMAPRTLSAMAHRPAYSSDGDYFSNPNAENVFDLIYEMMNQVNPVKYPEK